jgi:hypothetical protein
MRTEVLWEQLIDRGLEHLILQQGAQIEAEGLIVGMLKDVTYRIQYRIVCDVNWNTQSVSVKDLLSSKEFTLTRSGEEWLDEQDRVIESLRGCSDVDIQVTPFTNTLPINRLNLKQNESKEIAVVYVSVPELELSRFEQRYTCLSKDKGGGVYKYESLISGFTSELKVDADGLVVDYPGIFKLIWKQTQT